MLPQFSYHWDEAYGVGHLNVKIGEIEKTGYEEVDKFNELIIKIFNLASGNIFNRGSTLSWNVWFEEPELVDQKEWAEHAALWRESLDEDGTSPRAEGSTTKHFDGSEFKPLELTFTQEFKLISKSLKWVSKEVVVGGIKSDAQHFAEIDFDRFKTAAEDLVDDYHDVKDRLADDFEHVKDFVHWK
jgi:hypothetical protein